MYLVLHLCAYMHTYAMFIFNFIYCIFTYAGYVHVPFCSTSLIFSVCLDETTSCYMTIFNVSLVVSLSTFFVLL